MIKSYFLIILLITVIFISGCTGGGDGGGGGGGGGGGPPSCSASLSLTSTGKDTCTIKATITASYCDNKSYEVKNICSGTIASNSFSKECSWTVSYGSYNYELYINNELKSSAPIVCKQLSTCPDGTYYDGCSVTKPLYCNNGVLINKCSFCGCPTNQLCNQTSEGCYSICSDGTPHGQCSVSKPKYCDNGNLINKCSVCGCPTGQNCNTTAEECYIPLKCSDGTLYGYCSSTKPKYCDNGILIDKCSVCGCPTDKICNITSEKCYAPSSCSGSVSLNLIPSTVEPNGLIMPSASGLASCDNKIAYFKKNSCAGTQVSSCTILSGNCTGSSFTAPSAEGLYTYYACIDKNGDGDFTDSGENSSKTLNVTEINKEYILNYLNRLMNSYNTLGFFSLVFTLDSYDLLEVEIPNKTQVIDYLNSQQSSEGTWGTGTDHYVPVTAQILMFYNRSGVKPAKSLEPFFSAVDTWEEVNAHVQKYDPTNYWGGLWGYVVSYVVYKHEAPPWTPEFLNAANVNFSSWAYTNHQRTHLIGNLLQLGEPVPRIDDVVNITLQQQQADGSWDGDETETVFTIQVLRFIKNQTTVNPSLIDSAINRGLEYVKKCYKTADFEGKTYGGFVQSPTKTATDLSPWYTAEGIWAVLNPESDIWSRWFVNVSPLLQSEIVHIDNSLEYLRAKGLGVHDMAEYVISKSFLGTEIPNKTQIINYFDNAQGADGSWSDAWTPMFTTYRVLMAYYIMNATPKKSLDAFFSKYDTWTEALNYTSETKTDLRDVYHITFAWTLYYQTYPSWLNDYFNLAEQDLSWTTTTDAHKRTHIVYNYVIARRNFPNLDGIINETLREQSLDGHWDYPPRQIYWNGMQLALLQEIIKLHPNHRTIEIQNSIDKSRTWTYNTYNTTIVNGVVMGRFGNSTTIEDALLTGIMAVGINGLMNINVDMTFQDILP